MTTDKVLSEPAYFWWNDEEANFSPGSVLPDAYCSGIIEIEANGRVTADLHGLVRWQPDDLNGNGFFKQGLCGLTVRNSQAVHLLNVGLGETRFVIGGLSSQQVTAEYCLLGNSKKLFHTPIENFEYVSIELIGLDPWLGDAPIKISINEDLVEASLARSSSIDYKLENGDGLELKRVINAPLSDRNLHSLFLKEDATLTYRCKLPAVKDAIQVYQNLIDFIMLFVDRAKDFSWPTIGFQNGLTCRLYFRRGQNSDVEVRLNDCWLTLPALKPNFGKLFFKWISICKEFGPGIYMYLGLRRGVSLYPENRFMNMIYGLEALHRSQEKDDNDSKIVAKVSRILNAIQIKDDKRWLKRYLEHAHEPSLETRIYRLFNTLPLRLDETLLLAFSKRCAASRNDISHFGTTRSAIDYEKFVNELMTIGEALELLYLFKIFQMMGLDDQIIAEVLSNGFRSHSVKVALWRAKLTDRDPFEPQQK